MIPMEKSPGSWKTVSRKEWGAADATSTPTPHVPKRIVIHHSFQPDSKSWNGITSVRGIQRYHQKTQGWADIAYHFIVSPDGKQVFLGRPEDTVGAHCGGVIPQGVRKVYGNTGSIGICLAGNYDQEQPSLEGLRTLLELIGQLRDQYSIAAANVLGHFEAWSRPPKTCPGKFLILALGWDLRLQRAFPKGL